MAGGRSRGLSGRVRIGYQRAFMIDDVRDRPADGHFVDGTHRFAVRVYHEDTDVSGVVYHTGYLRWMERARSDMLRLAGIDQRGHLDAGLGGYAVTELTIRYRASAKLSDALVIVSWLTQVSRAALAIQQRVMRGGVLLAEATVAVAMVSPAGRAIRHPPEWRAVFDRLLDQGRPIPA